MDTNFGDIDMNLTQPYVFKEFKRVLLEGFKHCPKCNKVLKLSEFAPTVKGGNLRRYACRKCLGRMGVERRGKIPK
jgi:hypothetical protein